LTARRPALAAMKVVVNARNGTRDFECAPGEKILLAGLASGGEVPHECGTGTCGTCKARRASGRTTTEWSEAPGHRYLKSEAELLMCQSVAQHDCVLEVGMPLKEATAPPPRALGGIVRGSRRLTHDVLAFDLDLDQPLDFAAGQFALLTVPGLRGAPCVSHGQLRRASREPGLRGEEEARRGGERAPLRGGDRGRAGGRLC